MGFWDHVAELRYRLVVSAVAVTACAVVGFVAYDWLITQVFLPPYCDAVADRASQLRGSECSLVIIGPLDGFRARLGVAFWVGLIAATPVIAYHLWRFITPGLKARERRWVAPFVTAATVLFAAGVLTAYVSLDRALDFLIGTSGSSVEALLTPGPYLSFVALMMAAFGLGFEFPVVLVFAQLAGVLSPRQLHRARRYAIVAIVALAALITPSGDPVTLALLSVPLYVFYEVSIVIGIVFTRRRRKASAASEPA